MVGYAHAQGSNGSGGEALAAPFIGFTIGTALFGITLTQAYRYFSRCAAKDSLCTKIKVFAVCILDLLHFIFSVDMMYTSLFLDFGSEEPFKKNIWNLKALGITQAVLIILVQILYLRRIHTFSHIPALNGEMFLKVMQVVLYSIGAIAIGSGIVFCYELQRLETILSPDGNTELIVYMGFGSTTVIDVVITAILCFVLYKGRTDIGAYRSQRNDRFYRSLITYALATGIVTSSTSLLVIVLYTARPDSLFYLAATFSAPRLYTNSLFPMLETVRRHVNNDTIDDFEDYNKPPSGIVFRGPLTSIPSMRARNTRRTTTNIDTSFINATRRSQRIVLPSSDSNRGLSDSESSDGDIEGQKNNAAVMQVEPDSDARNLYSPYYSPLEARKKMNSMMFKVQEPEGIGAAGGSWIDFWRAQRRLWFGWPVDRRSSL